MSGAARLAYWHAGSRWRWRSAWHERRARGGLSGAAGAHRGGLPGGRGRRSGVAGAGGRISAARSGQQFIVENRPGASSNIATEYAARAPKDGYTLFLGTVANVVNAAVSSNLSVRLRQGLRADRARRRPCRWCWWCIRRPASNSVAELIALAKSKPGQLNYASSGVATTPHLAGALLNARAGIKLVHVPYQGSSPAVTDLLAGRTQIMFSAVSVVLPHITGRHAQGAGLGRAEARQRAAWMCRRWRRSGCPSSTPASGSG